jgi:predicted RecA/RadA family phage recombinase
MNNYSQPGATLTLTAPYQRNAGEGALVGSIFAVAAETVANGMPGEFRTEGVFDLAKTSAQAWTQGQRIHWDNSNKRCDSDSTVGPLIGCATEAAANPSSTGKVKLLGNVPATAEGAQAAIADITDNSGGASADGTIGAVTAPTALTDNGGGTADGTVASQAAPVTLTDNTGLSGTHDDTLAATTVPADLTGGESPTEAEHNALLAVVRAMAQNASDTAQKVIELVAGETTAQNNLKEVTTALGQDRTAIVALTDAVKELSTKINTILAELRTAGIIASS